MSDKIIEEVVLAEKISLRDYLAMSAMGTVMDKLLFMSPHEKIAKECYKMADAMLEESKNGNKS